VLTAINHAKDLDRIQIHDCCHPRLEPRPGLRCRVLEVAHGPEPVFVSAEHPRAEFVHVRQPQQKGLIQRGPNIHRDTAKPTVVSHTGRPERMTASTRWFRNLVVERARRGTRGVDSKNESRSQAISSQYQRYLDHPPAQARPTRRNTTRA